MTDFYRLSGGGNDFLALVEPPAVPAASQIAAWCSRGLSLGADGLFTLERAAGGVRMRYANADGRAAELCLNGTRCAARLALELGWFEDRVTVLTGAAAVPAWRSGPTEITLELRCPDGIEPVEAKLEEATFAGWRVDAGVPHFVIEWPESLALAPVAALGARLRRHPVFAAGTNVDFVRFTAPDRLEIRTFERGVEAETLACGTGVLSAAALGWHRGDLGDSVAALTRGGFVLRVERSAPGAVCRLSGDARLIAHGELLAEAALLPAPPAWS